MFALVTALSLASAPANLPPSWVTVNCHRPQGMPLSIAMVESAPDGAVAELKELMAHRDKSEHISCGNQMAKLSGCMVRLDRGTALSSVEMNLPEVGDWSVSFRGPAAVELINILEELETSKGTPGKYIVSASGRLVCEAKEQVCTIRRVAAPVVGPHE